MIHQLTTFHLLVALGAAHLITSKVADLHRMHGAVSVRRVRVLLFHFVRTPTLFKTK